MTGTPLLSLAIWVPIVGGLLVLAFAGALAIGIADELHQATLPGRQAGWDDLAADAVGALIGTWVLARLGWAR